jgi:polyisoprenoid-binding protein YceI
VAGMLTRARLLIAALCIAVLAVGGGLWWFFRDDAPAEVSLDAAVESVAGAESSDDAATAPAADGSSASVDGIDGSWVVDTDTGEFDYESATGTFAGFRIAEELASVGSTTAVGRTGDVTGSIAIEGTTLTAASFEVDMTTITTNESRRDDKVQGALETGEYPTGTFTLTEPVELGDAAATGEAVAVTAVGELTIHGVTRQVEIPLDAQLVDSTVVITGSLDITFSDFDVEVPQSPVVVSVEDHGVVEMQLLLTKA